MNRTSNNIFLAFSTARSASWSCSYTSSHHCSVAKMCLETWFFFKKAVWRKSWSFLEFKNKSCCQNADVAKQAANGKASPPMPWAWETPSIISRPLAKKSASALTKGERSKSQWRSKTVSRITWVANTSLNFINNLWNREPWSLKDGALPLLKSHWQGTPQVSSRCLC